MGVSRWEGVYELNVSKIDHKAPLSEYKAKLFLTEVGITFESDLYSYERRAGTYSTIGEETNEDNEFVIELDKSSRDPDGLMVVIFKTIDLTDPETNQPKTRHIITVNVNEFSRGKVFSLRDF
jgi:hypothetical protein